MRRKWLVCLALALVALTGQTAFAAVTLRGDLKKVVAVGLKESEMADDADWEQPEVVLVNVRPDGKASSVSVYPWRVSGMDNLLSVALDEEQAAAAGLEPSVLLFTDAGEFAAKMPGVDAETFRYVRASPDGKILAVMLKAEGITSRWMFFSWPGLARLGGEMFTSVSTAQMGDGMEWAGNDAVVMDDFSQTPEGALRCADKDVCRIRSIYLYRIGAGERTVLFQGTSLCNYELDDIRDGTVFATSRYVTTPSDWDEHGWPRNPDSSKEVSMPLPAR